jgi:hypothetical protein
MFSHLPPPAWRNSLFSQFLVYQSSRMRMEAERGKITRPASYAVMVHLEYDLAHY